MPSVRFEMRLPEDLAGRVDEARGFESRASWLRRAAEEKLGSPEEAVRADVERVAGVVETEPRVPEDRARAAGLPAFNRASSLGGAARPIPRRS
jgi:hypothetical protein